MRQQIHETQMRIQQEMEDKIMENPKECPFCKQRASDYEYMFLKQRDICKGYQEIVTTLKDEVEQLTIEINKLNMKKKVRGVCF